MQKLFSYGTLQQDNVQLTTFGRKLTGKQDVLVGFVLTEVEITDELVLAKSGKKYHPMLKKTDNPNDQINGMVFEITDEELAQADAYEVDLYKRVSARFLSGETAWIYADASDDSL